MASLCFLLLLHVHQKKQKFFKASGKNNFLMKGGILSLTRNLQVPQFWLPTEGTTINISIDIATSRLHRLRGKIRLIMMSHASRITHQWWNHRWQGLLPTGLHHLVLNLIKRPMKCTLQLNKSVHWYPN